MKIGASCECVYFFRVCFIITIIIMIQIARAFCLAVFSLSFYSSTVWIIVRIFIYIYIYIICKREKKEDKKCVEKHFDGMYVDGWAICHPFQVKQTVILHHTNARVHSGILTWNAYFSFWSCAYLRAILKPRTDIHWDRFSRTSHSRHRLSSSQTHHPENWKKKKNE